MLVVEFRIDSPLLAETLAQHPAATITDEEGYYDGDTIKYLFWAECPDFTEFDTALAADPTVANPRVITETTTRRLYRVTLTEKGTRLSTFPAWSEFDLVLLEAHGTHEGWTVNHFNCDSAAMYHGRKEVAWKDGAGPNQLAGG